MTESQNIIIELNQLKNDLTNLTNLTYYIYEVTNQNINSLNVYLNSNFVKKEEIETIINELSMKNKNRIFKNHIKAKEKQRINEKTHTKMNSKDEFSEELVKNEYNLTSEQNQKLEEWTGLHCSDILFDSDVDDWSNPENFNKKIIEKQQLTFLIEDEDGELFGYYFDTKILKTYNYYQETDSNSFHFNLQSKNQRLKEPMKFKIKDLKKGAIQLYDNSDQWLIVFGDIYLKNFIYKNESYCYQSENYFNYNGTENALCGKEPENYGEMYFTPKRILVIQME